MSRPGALLPEQSARWVADVTGPGSRVASVRRLRRGGWHVNHALLVVDPGGTIHQLVLRRWARPGWDADDPDYTVEREVRVLHLLRSTPVPAPEVVAADPDGERCGVPAILLTRLPGHAPVAADIADDDSCRQLAEVLAQIHDIGDRAEGGLAPYRLYFDRVHATAPPWMQATPVWARAIAAVQAPPPPTAMTMIHRDYHPDNTLWSRRRLTGVVDWTQAAWGPPGLDLGHMRWNLVADHGEGVADRFLTAYAAATGRALGEQPYWDLVSLLDLLLDGDGPGDIEPIDLRRFEDHARAALARWT